MQTKNPASKHFFALFVAVVAIVAAGCGNDDRADLVNGKTLFVEKCGACHTLERAGTKGVVGPNLDDSFRSARADGMTADTVASVTDGQIQFPGPTGASVPDEYVMPANIVTGDDARDVSAYVGLVAGVEGQDEGRLASAGGGGDGKSIFTQNCGSCHALADAGTAGATGPKLDGIGKQGNKFIELAIVDPNAEIAKGFAQGVMPATYGDQFSEEELQALVDYLLEQK
jgi:mono/diheme cytochrome c family protein